jgi:hypothetical protein
MPSESVSPTPGQAAHLKLLENYTVANVQDLVAYLSVPSFEHVRILHTLVEAIAGDPAGQRSAR